MNCHLTKNKILNKIFIYKINLFQKIRIIYYRFLSVHKNKNIYQGAVINQPILLIGGGNITIKKSHIGVWPSPYYMNGYCHFEARGNVSKITIEDGVVINNNAVIISEGSSIFIDKNCLIGTELTIYDSDFHNLDPARRSDGDHKCEPVYVGKNVFIGSRVTILKGVSIGKNSVIASCSLVSSSIPDNVVYGGNPARFIKSI